MQQPADDDRERRDCRKHARTMLDKPSQAPRARAWVVCATRRSRRGPWVEPAIQSASSPLIATSASSLSSRRPRRIRLASFISSSNDQDPHTPVLEVDDLRLDPMTHRVSRGDRQIELSAKEFLLLAALMRHPEAVLTRQQLLDHAWDSEYEARSNVVDVYIGYLRDKVDRPFGRSNIETVRGVGYRLVATHDTGAEPAITGLG
jgi:DNA-binding response OmpR family regulator